MAKKDKTKKDTMKRDAPGKVVKAGAIPVRFAGERIEVCLVTSAARPDCYVLPKGSVNDNETPDQAACREAAEEAGLDGVILGLSQTVWAKSKFRKNKSYEATYFVMAVLKERSKWPERHLRRRAWFCSEKLPFDKMVKRDRKLIESALDRIKRGRLLQKAS